MNEWLSRVRHGDTFWWSHGSAEPQALLQSIALAREGIGRLSAVCIVPQSEPVRALCSDPAVSWSGIGPFGPLREVQQNGRFKILPVRYSELPRRLRAGRLRADVALIQVSLNVDDEFCLGVAVDYTPALLDVARVKIAQINRSMPVTCGATRVDRAKFDAIVDADLPLPQIPALHFASVERAIGENIARLVPDGACLEIGWGSLGDAVASALTEKRDLGVHTGFLTDSVAELMSSGVVTNRRKAAFPGASLGTVAFGTLDRLYRAMHGNNQFSLQPSDISHSPVVMAAIDNFHAINFALEVDLAGQVNTEMINGRYRGAIGGLSDFVEGARRSTGGRTIFALRARNGSQPGIVPNFADGIVTVPRQMVDFVVTEYGIADISGANFVESRRALIAIAHPEDRSQLEASTAWKI
jgi:acyl-CoA hydrolase